jgi:hypothetical protein
MLSQKKPKFPEGKNYEGTAQLLQNELQECGHKYRSAETLEFGGYLKETRKEGRNQKCNLFQR